MVTHSSVFAWRIPWTEEPGGLQSMGSIQSDMTEYLHFHVTLTSRLVSLEEEFSKQNWSHGMCHEGQTATTLGSKT